jgi:hypothetical protein
MLFGEKGSKFEHLAFIDLDFKNLSFSFLIRDL